MPMGAGAASCWYWRSLGELYWFGSLNGGTLGAWRPVSDRRLSRPCCALPRRGLLPNGWGAMTVMAPGVPREAPVPEPEPEPEPEPDPEPAAPPLEPESPCGDACIIEMGGSCKGLAGRSGATFGLKFMAASCLDTC